MKHIIKVSLLQQLYSQTDILKQTDRKIEYRIMHSDINNNKQTATQRLYIRHFCISTVSHILLTLISSQLLPWYSYQSYLWPSNTSWLSPLTNFDGYHYQYNQYTHQPNFAFLPGYTLLVRVILQICGKYIGIIILWAVNRLAVLGTIFQLDHIVTILGMNQYKRVACVMLYIYNPAGVFFHSIYSQAIYTFLTFKYVSLCLQYFHYTPSSSSSSTKSLHLLFYSTVCLIISLIIRTTSLFLLPIIGFPILYLFFTALHKRNITDILKWGITGGLILTCALTVFGCIMYWQYSSMCHSIRGNIQLCGAQFANVYSYVQAKYWDVGLLTYYKLNNLLFIVLGLPAVILSILFFPFTSTVKYLFNLNMVSVCKLGLQISLLSYLLVTVLLTNIQSSTRFLCTHPAFYINCVNLLHKDNTEINDNAESKDKNTVNVKDKQNIGFVIFRAVFTMWQFGYFYVGILLFSVGFPWT